mmetsp:Transcript_1256/g.2272  ORF Transcript_1256/g.2272 Transcript_1256/m.2272 type:complete len:100 (-) Transcript_1256:15-314(-)
MKELEHKREIERLWQEKLIIYREQRELELEELRKKEEEERIYQQAIEDYKQQLLAEHAALLTQFNPKAASQYGASVAGGGSAKVAGYEQNSGYQKGSIN